MEVRKKSILSYLDTLNPEDKKGKPRKNLLEEWRSEDD